MSYTAHQDTFARDRLPPREQWPELIFDLPELQYPERLNCATEILDQAVMMQGWGDRIALRGPLGTLTYAELLAQANRIAHVLVSDLGLVPGNRVLLHSANTPLMAACWFAIQKAGGIAVSTMPLLRAKELNDIIGKAQVSHVLAEHGLLGELEKARQNHPAVKHVLHIYGPDDAQSLTRHMMGKPAEFTNVDTAADDIALIAFTSGTTGRPKATLHFQRDVMAICDCFPRSTLKPQPEDIFLGTAPIAFTFGLGGLLLFPLRYGASSVLGVQSVGELLLRAIEEYRVTIGMFVPTMYRMALAKTDRYDLRSMRKCVSAGEALPLATREAWERATGVRLIDGIGSTEMLHIFVSAADDDIRPGAIGRPIPGYQARVIDDAGNPVPPGTPGRLAVKGPTGCRYLDDVRQLDYVRDGWNVTGDSFVMDADGYLYYQSRTDDMIISAGHNIGGPEVEDTLLKHPAVAECAVIGVPDTDRGQAVKAYVVLRPGYAGNDTLREELQNHAKALLAPYKYPRLIEFRDALPRTETGKLQRFKLREEALRGGSAPGRYEESQPPSPHMLIQPEGWARPKGFSNGIKTRGNYVSVAGQAGWDGQRRFVSDNFSEQARQALQNVADVVRAAGGAPEHIVRLTWYVTNKQEYLAQSKALGQAYRSVMGRFFPPMTVVQVAALVEDAAKVEIEATAIIPDA